MTQFDDCEAMKHDKTKKSDRVPRRRKIVQFLFVSDDRASMEAISLLCVRFFALQHNAREKEHFGHKKKNGGFNSTQNDGDARPQLFLRRVHMFRIEWRGGREVQESSALPCLSRRKTFVFTGVRTTSPGPAVGGEEGRTRRQKQVPSTIARTGTFVVRVRGNPSHRLKVVCGKPIVLEYVRREYRCADCDAHSTPQPSRKAAVPRTY